MNFSVSAFKKLTYLYLSIPFFMFLAGWLDPVFAIISVCALTFILYKLSNENDSSLVMYILFNDQKILMMGDASEVVEEKLLKEKEQEEETENTIEEGNG